MQHSHGNIPYPFDLSGYSSPANELHALAKTCSHVCSWNHFYVSCARNPFCSCTRCCFWCVRVWTENLPLVLGRSYVDLRLEFRNSTDRICSSGFVPNPHLVCSRSGIDFEKMKWPLKYVSSDAFELWSTRKRKNTFNNSESYLIYFWTVAKLYHDNTNL